LRLKPHASPFERALIDWAGAYIARDQIAQIRYLKIALDYSPGNDVLLFTLAIIEQRANNYQGAIDVLLPVVKSNWQFSTAHYLVAYCYDQLKEYAKAKEILVHALTLRWVYHDIYRFLSVYALMDDDTTKAREYETAYLQAGKVFGLPPDQMYATLASNNLSEGFYDAAVRHYGAAVSLEPKNATYRDELGEAFFLLGNRKSAGEEFLQAMKLDPMLAHAHPRLAELSEANNDTAASIRHYTAYLKLDSAGSRVAEVRQRMSRLGTPSYSIAKWSNPEHLN
jgi:tetratricopeptide (TPR) repeat protein